MHYETKNNIGFGLLFMGGLTIVGGLMFLGNVAAIIVALLGVAACGVGGYMMTRSFTEVDKDHPDYQQYQERFHTQNDRRSN